jgi:hypothetical protein
MPERSLLQTVAAFVDGWTSDAAYTQWSAPADAIVSKRVSNRF